MIASEQVCSPGDAAYIDSGTSTTVRRASVVRSLAYDGMDYELSAHTQCLSRALHRSRKGAWVKYAVALLLALTTLTPTATAVAAYDTASRSEPLGNTRNYVYDDRAELGFQAHLMDYDADLIHMRARVFDPHTGLFFQRDPSGYVDSVNLYAGMRWDTVNLRDPTGRESGFGGSLMAPNMKGPGLLQIWADAAKRKILSGLNAMASGMQLATAAQFCQSCGFEDPGSMEGPSKVLMVGGALTAAEGVTEHPATILAPSVASGAGRVSRAASGVVKRSAGRTIRVRTRSGAIRNVPAGQFGGMPPEPRVLGVADNQVDRFIREASALEIDGHPLIDELHVFGSRAGSKHRGRGPLSDSDIDVLFVINPAIMKDKQRKLLGQFELEAVIEDFSQRTGLPVDDNFARSVDLFSRGNGFGDDAPFRKLFKRKGQ